MSKQNRRSSILKQNSDDASIEPARPKRRVSFHTHRIVKEYEKNGEGDVDHTPQRERMQYSGQSDLSASLTDPHLLSNKENHSHVDISVHEVRETTFNKYPDNTFAFIDKVDRHVEIHQTSSSCAGRGQMETIENADNTMMLFGNSKPIENEHNSLPSTPNANMPTTPGFDRTMAVFRSPGSVKSAEDQFEMEGDKTFAMFNATTMSNGAASDTLDFGNRSGEDLDELIFGDEEAMNVDTEDLKFIGMKAESTRKSDMASPVKVDDTFVVSTPQKAEPSQSSTMPVVMEVSTRETSSVLTFEEARNGVSSRESTFRTTSTRTEVVSGAVPMEGIEVESAKSGSEPTENSSKPTVPLEQTYVFENGARVPAQSTPEFVQEPKVPVYATLKAAVGMHLKPRPELLASPKNTDSLDSTFCQSPTRTVRLETTQTLNNKIRRMSGALMEAVQKKRRSDVLKTAGKPDHVESPMEVAKTQPTEASFSTTPVRANQTFTLPASPAPEAANPKTNASTFSDILNLSRIQDPTNMFDESSFVRTAPGTANNTFNAINSTRLEDIHTPVPMFEGTLNGTNAPEDKANSSAESELSNSFSQRLSFDPSSGQKTSESIVPLGIFDPDETVGASRAQASFSTTKLRNIYEEFNLDDLDSYCEAVTTGNVDLAGAEEAMENASMVNTSASEDMTKSMSCRTPMKRCQLRVSEPSFGLSSASDGDLTQEKMESVSGGIAVSPVAMNGSENDVSGAEVVENGTYDVPVATIARENDTSDGHVTVDTAESVTSDVTQPTGTTENGTYDVPVASIPAPADESDGGTYTLSPNHSLLRQIDPHKLATPSKPLSFASADTVNRSIAENLSNSMAFTAMTYSFSQYGFADRHLTAEESVRLAKFSDEVAGLQALARPLGSRWPNLVSLADDIVPGFVIYEAPQKFADLNYLIEAAYCDMFLEAATTPKELKEQVVLVRQKFKLAFDARKALVQLLKATYPRSAFLEESKAYCVELLLAGNQAKYDEYIASFLMAKAKNTPSEAQKLYEQRSRECKQEGDAEVAAIDAKIEQLQKAKTEIYANFSTKM